MKTRAVQDVPTASAIEPDTEPTRNSYILTLRLPDAQAYNNAEFGINYAEALLGPLGVKIDRNFRFEPFDSGPDDQGARYVSYILRAEMTAEAAQAVAARGISVERARIDSASDGG
jgi:hypothetical protein